MIHLLVMEMMLITSSSLHQCKYRHFYSETDDPQDHKLNYEKLLLLYSPFSYTGFDTIIALKMFLHLKLL